MLIYFVGIVKFQLFSAMLATQQRDVTSEGRSTFKEMISSVCSLDSVTGPVLGILNN